MSHLFVSEPVLRFGEDEPPADLADRLQALVNDHRPAEAVLTFQRENVRLSEAELDQLAASDAFAAMVELAQTAVYDTRLIAVASTPSPAVLHCGVPMTVLRGEPAASIFVDGCPRLASMVPGADFTVVPESHDHAVDPVGTVREVMRRAS